MSIHGRFIKVVLLLLLGVSALWADKLSIHLSSKSVTEGESIDVVLSAQGRDVKFPDVLDVGGFPISSKYRSSSQEMSIVNGTTAMKRVVKYGFTFTPEVNMTLPSYTVKIDGKEYKTNPVKISIISPGATNPTAGVVTNNGYKLTLKSNKSEVYLGNSFVVDAILFVPNGSGRPRGEYHEPVFKNASARPIQKSKITRSYAGASKIIASYLVTPKQEGSVDIVNPRVDIAISQRGSDPFNGMFGNPSYKMKRVKGNNLKIKVIMPPEKSDLVGEFTMHTSLDHSKAKANKPITYTVIVEGNGELDSLQDHQFDIDGVSSYGDDGVVTHSMDGDKLVNRYVKKYVFVSDKSFTIPSFKITYYDTKEKRVKSLVSPAKSIVINGGKIMPSSAINTKKRVKADTEESGKKAAKEIKTKEDNSTKVAKTDSILEDTEYNKQRDNANQSSLFWLYVVGGILSLVGILYWLFAHNKSGIGQSSYNTNEALNALYPHVDKNPEIEEKVSRLYELKNGNKDIKIDKKKVARLIEDIRESKI